MSTTKITTRKSTARAIAIFNTVDSFQVYELGSGGWHDVINCASGKVFRMGDRALCEALAHYGDSVLIEHWESK